MRRVETPRTGLDERSFEETEPGAYGAENSMSPTWWDSGSRMTRRGNLTAPLAEEAFMAHGRAQVGPQYLERDVALVLQVMGNAQLYLA